MAQGNDFTTRVFHDDGRIEESSIHFDVYPKDETVMALMDDLDDGTDPSKDSVSISHADGRQFCMRYGKTRHWASGEAL